MTYYVPDQWSNFSIEFNFTNGYNQNGSCMDPFNESDPSCILDSLEEPLSSIEIAIIVFLSGFILSIIIGNVFVILSVCLFQNMRTLTNGLIVSLASADLLVALIVLPISLFHEIVGRWTLGSVVCDFWITSDVFCCSSSILNIVVIAVDRYWLITKNVRYTHNTTFPRKKVIILMGTFAWIAAIIISGSPLLGWNKGNEKDDPNLCMISQDVGYTVFSTFGAFWLPLAVILIVYFKIFKIARRRAISRAKARSVHPSFNNSTMMTEMNGKTASRHSRRSDGSDSPPQSPGSAHTNSTRSCQSGSGSRKRRFRYRRSDSQSSRRTPYRGRLRSSARTLGLIIGGFVLCWLPFFILATVVPFCDVCMPPEIVGSVALWLGYSNSLLNPAIYAIWDKNFRRSFKKLITCDIRCTSIF